MRFSSAQPDAESLVNMHNIDAIDAGDRDHTGSKKLNLALLGLYQRNSLTALSARRVRALFLADFQYLSLPDRILRRVAVVKNLGRYNTVDL